MYILLDTGLSIKTRKNKQDKITHDGIQMSNFGYAFIDTLEEHSKVTYNHTIEEYRAIHGTLKTRDVTL
jgi:hypothetical protein